MTDTGPSARAAALQAILDNAPIGVWYQDPTGRLVFVNRAFCGAIGVSEDRFLSVPHYVQLLDETTAQVCIASDKAALAHDGPRSSREQLRFVDGALHDLDIVKVRVTNTEGEFLGLVGLSADVTERMRSDASMKRQVAGLRKLSEVASQPGLEPRESLRHALQAAVEHFGMEYAIIGRLAGGDTLAVEVHVSPAGALADDQTWPLAQTPCGPMLASGDVLAFPSGAPSIAAPRLVDLELGSYLGVPLHERGQIAGSLCVFSTRRPAAPFDDADIEFMRLLGRLVETTRERRAALRRLDEAHTQLAAIVDSAMDAMITHDGNQRIVLFNAAAEKMFRCRAADAIGKPLDHFLPERFRAAHRGHVEDFAQSGTTHRSMGGARVFALRSDGEEFPCEATISRVVVEGRTLLTVILRDVTERDRAEATRRALELRAQQTQKMDALGTLAGGIAHDFNNVLSAILLNAEYTLQGELPTDGRESVEGILTAGNRARDLVKRILTFSRKQAVARSPVFLKLAVEEAIGFLRATLPAGIEVVGRLDPNVGRVAADRTELHQVVVNLCTNAWHAIGDRPGRIELRLEEVGRAAEGELPPGRYAELTVTDSGSGMDAETLRRVFEPFFTTKREGEGTGLGLSIVHGIVSDLGGRVSGASEPGKGSSFTVLLPIIEGDGPAASASARISLNSGGGRPVLLLDDEAGVVHAVSRALHRFGYDVTGFTSPRAALAAVREARTRFSVMVLDLNMPGLSGLDFVRELAHLPDAVPVVLTSGNLQQAQREEAERLGVRHFLQKPYSATDLGELLGTLLG